MMMTNGYSLELACELDQYSPLRLLQSRLRYELTDMWPTRTRELCPPAFGALVESGAIELPELDERTERPTLVLFLPKPLLPLVTHETDIPHACVHANVALTAQDAYLCWLVPCSAKHLPALWVSLSDLMPALLDAYAVGGEPVLQVIFVADGVFRTTVVVPGAMFWQWRSALRACEQVPGPYRDDELVQAKHRADRCGLRPWLFTKYHLHNEGLPMAVHWAPIAQVRAECWEREWLSLDADVHSR